MFSFQRRKILTRDSSSFLDIFAFRTRNKLSSRENREISLEYRISYSSCVLVTCGWSVVTFAYVTTPFSLYSSFKALTRILFARRQRDRKVSQCQKDVNKIGETDGTCITSLNSLYSFHRKTMIYKQKIKYWHKVCQMYIIIKHINRYVLKRQFISN